MLLAMFLLGHSYSQAIPHGHAFIIHLSHGALLLLSFPSGLLSDPKPRNRRPTYLFSAQLQAVGFFINQSQKAVKRWQKLYNHNPKKCCKKLNQVLWPCAPETKDLY